MTPTSQANSQDEADRLNSALGAVCRAQAAAREQARWLEAQLAEHRLSGPEFLLLWLIGGNASADLPQHALADQIGLSPAQASVLLEKLRHGGWLTGVRDAHDRRRQLWQLTPEGRERLEAICGAMMARGQAHGMLFVGSARKEAAA